jgi:hypothetical protein
MKSVSFRLARLPVLLPIRTRNECLPLHSATLWRYPGIVVPYNESQPELVAGKVAYLTITGDIPFFIRKVQEAGPIGFLLNDPLSGTFTLIGQASLLRTAAVFFV